MISMLTGVLTLIARNMITIWAITKSHKGVIHSLFVNYLTVNRTNDAIQGIFIRAEPV